MKATNDACSLEHYEHRTFFCVFFATNVNVHVDKIPVYLLHNAAMNLSQRDI